MTTPQTEGVRPTSTVEEAPGPPPDWRHRDHPLFTALAGFFTGLLFVTVVPGGFAGLLRLLFDYDTAARLFPIVAGRPRRAHRRWSPARGRAGSVSTWCSGWWSTALVFLGVTSLVLYFMVRYDA